jgi:HD superfamily phosphohydrolase
MKALSFVSLLGLGLAVFAQADRIHDKFGIPTHTCEVTGAVVFVAGAILIVGTWGRSMLAWIRRLMTAPALAKSLQAQLEQLRTEHSQTIESLADRHAAEVETLRRESREENGELRAEITQVRLEHLARLPERAKALASVWVSRKSPPPQPTFMHRDDPIYGQLAIHERLFPVLCHPLFQRLNWVRQLSFAYLTFPSASHTRLSHLLGVAKNAQEVLRKILTKRVAYKPLREDPDTRLLMLESKPARLNLNSDQIEEILLKAQLCALLHDIGHGPFGHALDKLVPYLGDVESSDPPDTVYSQRYIKEYLGDVIREAGFQPDQIARILDKNRRDELSGFDVLIADLVASAVDIDRMDYLARDAHMTGLQMGYVNTEALREQMCPLEEKGDYKLVYAPAALTEMEDLAQAHHNMYIHCYEHPRKLAAERLLMRAVRYLVTQGLKRDDLMLLSDDQLIAVLSEFLAPGTPEGECFRALRENVHFITAAEYHISKWNPVDKELECNPELSATAQAWFEQRGKGKKFLRRVFVDDPKSWEDQICDVAGLAEEERWKVIVTVPAYDVKLRKESGALVVIKRPSGELLLDDFQHASPILNNILTILVPERHVLRVVVAEDLRPDISKFAKAADDLFKQRQVSPA